MHPPEQSELSVTEEIDPELIGKGGWFTARREGFLGVLILAGVLLWAGWQWVDTERKTSSYQAASRAMSARDWDTALTGFKKASGYRDADQRAHDADELIEDRDRHYNLAVEHSARKEGIRALLEIEQVERIQPHYSDTAHLEEQARRYAYDNALQGAIVQRNNVKPPGLYYRMYGKWVWLEGSDPLSQVRSTSCEGRVVYDAPDPADSNRPTGKTQIRKVILATLPQEGSTSAAIYKQLAYNLGDYNLFNCQSDGVWAAKNSGSTSMGRGPIVQGLASLQEVAFQGNDQSEATKLSVPTSPANRLILDMDFTHRQVLVAEWQYEVLTGTRAVPIVSVFVEGIEGNTEANRGNQRLVYIHRGTLYNARLSPDGTYALLTTVTYEADQYGTSLVSSKTLIMVNLHGESGPRVLAQENRLSEDASHNPHLSSFIVSRGPYIGHFVIYREAEENGNKITILEVFNPKNPSTPSAQVKLRSNDFQGGVNWTGAQNSQGMLLAAQPVFDDLSPSETVSATMSATLTLINFEWGKAPQAANVAIDPQSVALPAVLVGTNLVYGLYHVMREGNRRETYSLPSASLRVLEDIGNPSTISTMPKVTPQLVYSEPSLQLSEGPSSNLKAYYSYNYGPRALAYSDGKDLYVSAYDSAETLKLESGVTYLFTNTSLGTDYIFLR